MGKPISVEVDLYYAMTGRLNTTVRLFHKEEEDCFYGTHSMCRTGDILTIKKFPKNMSFMQCKVEVNGWLALREIDFLKNEEVR